MWAKEKLETKVDNIKKKKRQELDAAHRQPVTSHYPKGAFSFGIAMTWVAENLHRHLLATSLTQ